jgi:ribonuclease HI
MVQTRSQNAKLEGLASRLPRQRPTQKLTFNLPLVPAAAYRSQKLGEQLVELKVRRKERMCRLQQAILGPGGRIFNGRIIVPSDIDARMPDSVRLQDISTAIILDLALVYWVDGSYGHQRKAEGFMGAGVVWQDRGIDRFQSYKLGRRTGNNEDAEVFAIAAALGKAKEEVDQGRDFELVRVISDALCVLTGLRRGTQCRFGPMLTKRTALQAIYERADLLTSLGIQVELMWVKGHSKSEGNNLADKVANQAVKDQVAGINMISGNEDPTRPMTRADVPTMWKELGPDWVDEWLARANEHVTKDMYAHRHEKPDAQKGQFEPRQETFQVATTQRSDCNTILVPGPAALRDANSLQRGFIFLARNKYGNVSASVAIANLQEQRERVDLQIRNVERYIARFVKPKGLTRHRIELAELDRERARVEFELVMMGGVVAELAVEREKEERKLRLGSLEGKKEDVGKEDDDHGDLKSGLEGHEVGVKGEDLDDDDVEIARQIQDDIALSQRDC